MMWFTIQTVRQKIEVQSVAVSIDENGNEVKKDRPVIVGNEIEETEVLHVQHPDLFHPDPRVARRRAAELSGALVETGKTYAACGLEYAPASAVIYENDDRKPCAACQQIVSKAEAEHEIAKADLAKEQARIDSERAERESKAVGLSDIQKAELGFFGHTLGGD